MMNSASLFLCLVFLITAIGKLKSKYLLLDLEEDKIGNTPFRSNIVVNGLLQSSIISTTFKIFISNLEKSSSLIGCSSDEQCGIGQQCLVNGTCIERIGIHSRFAG